jgi:hypothetical protein
MARTGRRRSAAPVALAALLALLAPAAACSDSKSPAASSSASSPPPSIAAGDFSQLCAALADFHDPFKDLPPVPSPAQTEAALNALQGGYEVLARVAPPPVDQQIRTSLAALRAYDQFLAARSYDLVGLEGADRAEHDRLETEYANAAGAVESQVKASCASTSTSTS